MVENVLGEGTSFADVEQLRKELVIAEFKEFEREEEIINIQDDLARTKAEAQYEIDKLVLKYVNDKEAMKEAGFTRKPDYEAHLRKEVLTDEIRDLESKYEPLQVKLESKKHHKKITRLRIKNLERKLRNRQIFAVALFQGLSVDQELMEGITAK